MNGSAACRQNILSGCVAIALIVLATPCAAQYLPNVSGTTRAPVDIPQTNLTPVQSQGFSSSVYGPPVSATPSYAPPAYTPPIAPTTPYPGSPSVAPPSVNYGTPLYDPYSTGATPGTYSPALPATPPISQPQFPGWLPGGSPSSNGGLLNQWFGGTNSSAAFGPGNPGFNTTYSNNGYSNPAFPPQAYPSGSPNSLFPQGLAAGGFFGGGSMMGAPGLTYNSYRLYQGPRLRNTWINDGDGGDSLESNDIDASLVFAFPNFLYSNQPVYVVPSFGLHLLDGPDGSQGFDLPPQLYDAFVDAGWQSDPAQMIGADLGLRVGVFSDFESTDTDSIRILGKGLVSFRLTPYSTVKGGVYYLDRNDTKLIPALGLLYQPTPMSRFDISFPQPKLSQYFATLGTQDVWIYIGADFYGGGAWTITRTDGRAQSIDINDRRVTLGLEWGRSELIRNGRHTGYVEVGYVFDREVLYFPGSERFKPDDTFMISLGIGY